MERNNPRTTHDSLNVFDDEFAVDDFDFVGDGFAPGHVQNVGNDESEEDEPAIRSVAAHMADMPITPASPMPRTRGDRSSIRKSRDADNPFRSAEDEDDGRSAAARTPSIRSQSTVAYAPGNPHRSTSSSTSSPAFARAQSPLQGGSGPSHPYAMYPQGTNLARTASVSTASTVRPQQPLLVDQQGPAHPYGMYPQNVSVEDVEEPQDHATSHVQAHIPVGFPGRTQAYHRQQGPEGEEHDIVGLDGHAEQLPPYSEYPEDGVPKHIVLPNQAVTITPPNGTQLTVPLMPARPQSMSDAGNGPAHSQAYVDMEQMESNDATPAAPKRWRDKSWKEKRKTKFCGIPFWWILLSLCVLAFIAIVLGGAIGGFMKSQKKNTGKRPDRMLPSSTSLFDASPIPTSSSGSPPPTGTFALVLGSPEAVQADCLADQDYNLAWSCHMAGQQSLGISIEEPPRNSGPGAWEGASLLDTCPGNSYTNISYGTQTPATSFSQFIAVSDNDDPDRGPAFYFQAFYDKVVVAPPNAFASASSAKRDSHLPSVADAWYTRHQIAPAEQPWFCYWNGTFIEGFIYSFNTSASTHSSPSSTSSSTSLSTSYPSSYTTTSTILEVSGPSTTATVRMASSTSTAYDAWASSATRKARRYYNDNDSSFPQFDYVVKIEERRISGSPQPYCQKMQILDDGTAGIVTDPTTGDPVTIQLIEGDPAYSAYQSSSSSSSSSSLSSSSRMRKRTDPVPGGCHCQWWSGA